MGQLGSTFVHLGSLRRQNHMFSDLFQGECLWRERRGCWRRQEKREEEVGRRGGEEGHETKV